MTYGIRFQPDDGGATVTMDGGRYISPLGSYDLPQGSRSVTMSRSMPSGFTQLCIPTSMVHVYPSDPPSMAYITSLSVSGSTLSYGVYPTDMSGTYAPFHTAVFAVSPAEDQGSGYGIRINNGSNFMEVSDTSSLGFVSYRGTIDISGSWSIPSDVLALGDYVVFANWNDTSTPLYMNRSNNSIQCYSGFSNANGSVVGGSVSGVRVVIVSCGSAPALPSSGYGIVIRNSAGQVTFSSRYPLVKWNGQGYNFSSWTNYDTGGGEKLSWTSPSGTINGSPMVPLSSIGTQSGDYTQSISGGWTARPFLYAGMKMDGTRVSSARGAPGNARFYSGQSPTAAQFAIFLPCLDTADYF